MIHHHGCCYSPCALTWDCSVRIIADRRLSLYSIIVPFFSFFFLIFLFLSSFFSHISIWAHFWFSSSSSGENLFFSIFGPDLLRLSMQSLANYLFPSSSSLRSLLKLRCPPATPPHGAVIMHPSLLVDKDKKPLFLYTLFNSNLSNLRNSIRFAFFPISPVILLLVSLFDAPQSSFTP